MKTLPFYLKSKQQSIVLVFLIILSFTLINQKVNAKENSRNLLPVSYLTGQLNPEDFVLSSLGVSAPLVLDAYDFPGVIKVAGFLQGDIEKVSGAKPRIIMGELQPTPEVVIIGTLGKSSLIGQLVEAGKINVDDIKGKWEASMMQVVKEPMQGVEKALVIVGSDKRGTIYGMFDLSRQIGVSPWHFWSDVPPKKNSELYIKAGYYYLGAPKVKYRGIFLNDEEPALGRWAVENYGGFNHLFYEHVFELILRLKGNYLWPAMWWATFNTNDPQNPELADELGIVMGSSHHEPMNRAHKEWGPWGGGEWNYETNPEQLRQFWTEGIERMGDRETIINMAMRGDGDMGMSRETNVALLEKIVADQRKIIEEVTGKDVTETPQLWALYKEVQDYYDEGMRVPDDVTLLLCDDNWGNIRKLPKPDDPPRSGGYGIYYHFDYVGGPRNYKWLNVSPLPRIWEQMNLAYRHGVDRIWIVNVGDLKPMELGISFWFDFAFDPDAWSQDDLIQYQQLWAKEQFGAEHADEIAEMIRLYLKYNSRRTPEMLAPETYSLLNFREAETIRDDYNSLAARAGKLYDIIPDEQRDAYYQLVLHPIKACANLNDLYVTTAQNRMYASQGRTLTNSLADRVAVLFENDSKITNYYHNGLAGGKWNHMMAQNHIGYRMWQEPRMQTMPRVENIEIPEEAQMGVAIEGSEKSWTEGEADVELPEMDVLNKDAVFIEVFNKGQESFNFKVKTGEKWLTVNPSEGEITSETRLWVMADWNKVPKGVNRIPVTISGNGQEVTVIAVVRNPELNDIKNAFVENQGYVSVETEHFTRKVENENIKWIELPDLGKTAGSMTVTPVTASPVSPEGNNPRLEYDFVLFEPGEIEVSVLLSPTLNYYNNDGRKIAVSVDDEEPQILNMHEGFNNRVMETWEGNSIAVVSSVHNVISAGKHTLKLWMVDSGLVIQKIIIRRGPEKRTYLGPPESKIL
ncbi:MAG: glycosyl hydrolase 115 family protein [Prolixibacteraceae bacterium]|nr:glycosyl hydrolase 115 family protein [Prolixibacteraceae bacterium]MBN2773101.1 glycosyl hydrolase 115 family protein [Prolixibacteraceae bacterium]